MPRLSYIPVAIFLLGSNCLFSIGVGQEFSDHLPIVYDTITVYDTMTVYDTIWEYETIYDTIWTADTGGIDSINIRFFKLNPVEIGRISGSLISSEIYTLRFPHDEGSVMALPKYSIWDEIREEIRYIGNASLTGRSIKRSKGRFTLNPSEGQLDLRAFGRGTLSIDGYIGVYYQQIHNHYGSGSLQSGSDSTSIKPVSGNEHGIRVNYNIYQLTAQTGIGYSQLRERIDYTQGVMNIDTNTYYITLPNMPGNDSIKQYNYDTTFTYSHYLFESTHDIVEVPLILSYGFLITQRALLDLKFGGVNQFHHYSKGRLVNESDSFVDIDRVVSFTKYNLALYIGTSLFYYLTDNICLGADAFYKYPFKPYATSSDIDYYRHTYGLALSFRFNF